MLRQLLTLAFLSLLLSACQSDKPTTGTDSEIIDTPATTTTKQVTGTKIQSYAPDNFRIIWNDEFNYNGLPDSTKWGYQKGGFGWLAKELQMYTEADPDNVFVRDGNLVITARKEKMARNNYTSTRMVTKKKALFRQGYFEARIKFPAGEGLRSAWWMVGDTVSKIGWPNAGEIDIVEHYGKIPEYVNAAVQTVENVWNDGGQKGGGVKVPTATSEFHVYSCLWTDQKLTFYIDGQPYWFYQPEFLKPETSWPFRWPFYMAFNLSVGGERGQQSNNIAPETLPAEMVIDYVRVFQPKQ